MITEHALLPDRPGLEDHLIGFPESAAHQEWRSLRHPFHDPAPVAERFLQAQAG